MIPEVAVLRKAMRQQRMTAVELARLSGVSESMVYKTFLGKKIPTIPVFGRLARALGVSVAVPQQKKSA